MESGEFFAGEAQLYAAERVGLDQVDKLPLNFSRRQLGLNFTNGHGRNDSLQQAADGTGKAYIHLSDSKLGVAVGAIVGQVDVIYADDFAAVGVDNLLIEQVFSNG